MGREREKMQLYISFMTKSTAAAMYWVTQLDTRDTVE